MPSDEAPSRSRWVLAAVLVAGFAARLLVATMGHSYDFDSYRIVVDVVESGGNVYAETGRYNYGPVWFQVLHLLDRLSGGDATRFRYLLAALLGLVDVGIFLVLLRALGRFVAVAFFLSPVSVVVSGYQCQFDNVAILLGLLAVSILGDSFEEPVGPRKVLGLVLLGVSLMTKHVLFAFPFWLAVKQRGLREKCVVLLVPVAVFAAGFLPYWKDGRDGIVENVFRYGSRSQGYFSELFAPGIVRLVLSSQALWVVVLVVFALVAARRSALESLVLYTAVLVAASPAIANQYLAIPVVFVAAHLNPFTALYTVVATFHLLVDGDGLHLGYGFGRDAQYGTLVTLLVLAVVQVTWREELALGWRRLRGGVRSRLGLD